MTSDAGSGAVDAADAVTSIGANMPFATWGTPSALGTKQMSA